MEMALRITKAAANLKQVTANKSDRENSAKLTKYFHIVLKYTIDMY